MVLYPLPTFKDGDAIVMKHLALPKDSECSGSHWQLWFPSSRKKLPWANSGISLAYLEQSTVPPSLSPASGPVARHTVGM